VILESEKPKVLEVVDELACLDEATKVDIPTLRNNTNMIAERLKTIQARIKSAEENPQSTKRGDQFATVMKAFHSQSLSQFNQLEKYSEETITQMKNIGAWLNEENDVNGLYLKKLNEFRDSIKQCKTKMTKKREDEKKKRDDDKKKTDRMAGKESNNKESNNKESNQSLPPSPRLAAAEPSRRQPSDPMMKQICPGTSAELMEALKKRRRSAQKLPNLNTDGQ